MIRDIIDRAAGLAANGNPTVDAALDAYRLLDTHAVTRDGQVWVSVAFLCKRHADITARLLR